MYKKGFKDYHINYIINKVLSLYNFRLTLFND